MDWTETEMFKNIFNVETIVNVVTKNAVPEGDHYFSKLLRVIVTFINSEKDTHSTESFIVKAYPDGVMKDFMVESQAMSREITMYQKVIPALNKITERKLAPVCYDSPLNESIILEDLIFKDFTMEDRILQMDYSHCVSAIETLAFFHGSSIILYEINPDLINEVGKEVLYTEDNEQMKSFVIKGFEVLGSEVKNWPESSKYSTRLLEIGVKTWEDMVSAVRPLENDFLVLNHGDFWTNNMLFYHNKIGDVKNVVLIDFQFCRWANPAFDLQRFFYTSVRDFEDVPKLTDCYLTTINKLLKSHNRTTQISKEDLFKYLDRMNCYALICAVCLLPTCVQKKDQPLESEEDTMKNNDKLFESTNPYVKAVKDKTFRRIVSKMLDRFCEMGVL